MSGPIKIFCDKEEGVFPLCRKHAFSRKGGCSHKDFDKAPTTGMKCILCRRESEPPQLALSNQFTNEGYNKFIKEVAVILGQHITAKQKVFVAEAMTTFWPQMFLWGLYYAEQKPEHAYQMLRHFLFEQEGTQPLWDTLDFTPGDE